MNQGLASRDGIIAAQLASEDWLGPIDPFDDEMGYFTLFCGDNYETEILT